MKRLACLLTAALALSPGPLRAFYHLDVAIDYHATNGWRFTLHDLNYGNLPLEENPVFVPWYSLFRIPNHPAYTNLLGSPDRFAWIIPETPAFGLPYLGFSAEGIASGTFANNELSVRLTRVVGPGHCSGYETDPFGNFIAWWNTRDGLDTNDTRRLATGSGTHRHLNWAFEQAGRYALHFQVEGRLRASPQTTARSEAVVLFDVEPPPAPRLQMSAPVGGVATVLALASIPTLPCRIETTTDLRTWIPFTNFVPSSSTSSFSVTRDGTAFFRAAIQVP